MAVYGRLAVRVGPDENSHRIGETIAGSITSVFPRSGNLDGARQVTLGADALARTGFELCRIYNSGSACRAHVLFPRSMAALAGDSVFEPWRIGVSVRCRGSCADLAGMAVQTSRLDAADQIQLLDVFISG